MGKSFGRNKFIRTTDNVEKAVGNINGIEWFSTEFLLRLAAFTSFISVACNTPSTFDEFQKLQYVVFSVDIMISCLFTMEMVVKIRSRGILKGDSAYIKDKWCIFDAFMVIFLWISVILQIFQMCDIVKQRTPYSILRSPRPLIMLRAFKVSLNIQLPRARVHSIFKRSSEQVKSVSIFLVFFLTFYGMLGVQIFDKLSQHCVINETNPRSFNINSLAIPDTYCSQDIGIGYQCPDNMKCMDLKLTKQEAGYNGFDHFGTSILTVYESASQEGWVFIMYNVIDSFSSWKGYFFFITMIFFLAWLVKNVFIAVIIEVFAEVRVQFQHMWKRSNKVNVIDSSEVFQENSSKWKLIVLDNSHHEGLAPPCFQAILQSRAFHAFILFLVLIDSIIAFSPTNKAEDDIEPYQKLTLNNYHFVCQVCFTLLFDMEVFYKIWCLSFNGYAKRALHKFELILAIGTTIRILHKKLYYSDLTYFQVLRAIRLIKVSPTLEDFIMKVFGPGKKLGALVVFTMTSLIVVSVISLQLFCYVGNLESFQTFPGAFMSMFQILTQKGWTMIMYDCMIAVGTNFAPIVGIYFITYHLFATVIVLSLFVAVILDNLELDENIKRFKQVKAKEESAETKETLPLRLHIFQKFTEQPQMVLGSKIPSDLNIPKIRESLMKKFDDIFYHNSLDNYYNQPSEKHLHLINNIPSGISDYTTILKRNAVLNTIGDTVNQQILSESGQVHKDGLNIQISSEHIFRDRRALRSGSMKDQKGMETSGEKDSNGTELYTGDRKMDIDIKHFHEKKQQAEKRRNAQVEELRENHPFFDTSLLTFTQDSKIRILCASLVYARYCSSNNSSNVSEKRKYQKFQGLLGSVTYLDWFMILVTVMSCISMAYETPTSHFMKFTSLQISEYIFVVCTCIEISLKILANGFIFTPHAVTRDFGGLFDIFVCITSLIFLCWSPKEVSLSSGAQVIMILRCLRPLRIFTLVPHMRKVVYELVQGVKEICLVSALLLLLMFVFASYGVQIFSGQLARCNDPCIIKQENCIGSFLQKVAVTKLTLDEAAIKGGTPVILVPRVWANPRNFDFDDIWNSFLALFEVLSLEGWLEIRDVIIERMNDWRSIYVHIFVFIGCMIGLTLFVGVVITNFFENKGTALLTVDQKRWQDLKGRLKLAQPLHLPPRPDRSYFRGKVFDLIQHVYFKRFIAFLIIVNFFLLSVKWISDSQITEALAGTTATFTTIFAFEVVLKCIGMSPVGYWQSRRNRYDLFVTICGLTWMIIYFISSQSTSSDQEGNENILSYSLGVAIIILRFCAITGKHPTLKMLMLTIAVSVFKSFFIIAGLFLLVMCYAFIGVVLFGSVKYGENVDRHANFEKASTAMVVLIRIITGEDWNKIMHDSMLQEPYCTNNLNETDCGHPTAALIYFCSFYIIIAYICLNLLVAIIVENFSLFYSNEEDALLSYADLKNFQITWNIVDVQRRGFIPVHKVKFVLRLLKGRLEVDMERDRLLYKNMCCEMERLHGGGDVNFLEVLSMLSYRSVDIRKSLQLDELMDREDLEYNIEEEVAKQTIRNWLEKCLKRMRAKGKLLLRHSYMVSPMESGLEPSQLLSVPEFITIGNKLQNEIENTNNFHKKQLDKNLPIYEKKHSCIAGRHFKGFHSGVKSFTTNSYSGQHGNCLYIPSNKQQSKTINVCGVTEAKNWWKEQLTYISDSESE